MSENGEWRLWSRQENFSRHNGGLSKPDVSDGEEQKSTTMYEDYELKTEEDGRKYTTHNCTLIM